jgi:hypothetical protein
LPHHRERAPAREIVSTILRNNRNGLQPKKGICWSPPLWWWRWEVDACLKQNLADLLRMKSQTWTVLSFMFPPPNDFLGNNISDIL